jgi:hypothetical protein
MRANKRLGGQMPKSKKRGRSRHSEDPRTPSISLVPPPSPSPGLFDLRLFQFHSFDPTAEQVMEVVAYAIACLVSDRKGASATCHPILLLTPTEPLLNTKCNPYARRFAPPTSFGYYARPPPALLIVGAQVLLGSGDTYNTARRERTEFRD